MIQLNLLPDVKMEYIKAQRQRSLIISVSLLVTIAAVAILVLMLAVDGLQKKHLSDLSKDITTQSSKLEHEPQINKMLTVQNQLESLTSLHSDKPAASRLFDYLNQITPANVNITDFKIDFTQQTVTITGTSDSLANVNKYVDTLKFTKYTTDSSSSATPAFSNVVLGNFTLSTSQDPSQAATYTINLSYDKTIFDITQNVKLTIPNLVTTRSQVSQPQDLFRAAPAPARGGGQ